MIYIVCLIIAGGVLSLDLISKYLAVKNEFNFVVIDKLVKFQISYNKGAAFSFLSGKSWAQTFFIVITFIALAVLLGYFIYKIVTKKKPSWWVAVALSLMFAGALGNLIDRLALKMVRDFIFLFYETDIFPAIFNVADVALVSGVITLCFYLLFIDKDGIFKKKSKEEIDGGKEDNNG
ncbi:MAG: signal peptidase II [Clostridia bacterium]|nr:signal peptidase II [Clostridia bacterium]